ncbi:acetyltransferase [Paenibacillus sp.]|uniref:acetyltransferase n=1 Tax=Paenibacillus sp. TaxID=58172 RepID=UPI002811084F|nr:acetyltransferase [Paenibacillus sp.]
MRIALIGGGGHSKVVQDMIRARNDLTVAAILDDKYPSLELENGIYTGPVSSAPSLASGIDRLRFVIAIGDNRTRCAIAMRLGLRSDRYITLIHPRAYVSPRSVVGHGVVILANAVVNADAAVGDHAIVNSGAIVEHDSVVKGYAHIAPGATLTGGVKAGMGAFVGAGAAVIPGKSIGDWATVGAGATVIHDVPPRTTVVGAPARIVKYNEMGDDFDVEADRPKTNFLVQPAYERQRKSVY